MTIGSGGATRTPSHQTKLSARMDRFGIAIIVHGVGVAQAAAAAGYSVRVLKQNPSLAQGTSSRSSKSIHGRWCCTLQSGRGGIRMPREGVRQCLGPMGKRDSEARCPSPRPVLL